MRTGAVLQGLVLGLIIFNIFIRDTESGMQYTSNKFVDDMKLCGAADMLEGRSVIQRNLERLKNWACTNSVWFN